VALFRAGHDDAFRVIHDRYRQRLFAYTRQMLAHRQDAEDALQDIFVRAYAGLRASDRELALRAWLYRVAHNRCIDQLRRPAPPPPEVLELLRSPVHDPIAEADRRESLRRLIADVRRLPDQQRSALLMRELGGMSYADLAAALGVTIPAVKSLLVRARLALAQALEARDTACSEIREELIVSHDRGLRPNATARRHMRDCAGCREFRHDLRGVSRSFAALVPTLGPLGVLANVLGIGGAGSGAAGGALAAGGAAGSGTALVGVGTMSAGAAHVATLLAAAVVTAGGAVELQHTLPAPVHHARHARVTHVASPRRPIAASAYAPAPAADSAASSSFAPAAATPEVTPSIHSQIAAEQTGSSSSTSPTSQATATVPATTTVTVSVTSRPTGGISTSPSPDGTTPSKAASGTGTATSGSTQTSTTGSSTSTGTATTTGTASTQSGQTASGSTTGTQSGSTTSTQSTSSGSSSTDSSQSTSSSSTGSSTGTAGTGETPSSTQ
jgi:RNA polymerase sigma factor (sigma-70 family)